jgi:hypothetical protein
VLNQFDQHAQRGLGVNKGDLGVVQARARLLVDQLHALAAQMLERRLDVVDAVGDMVGALAALAQKLGEGRLIRGRRDQLDQRLAHLRDRDAHMAIAQLGVFPFLYAEGASIKGDSFLKIVDRDTDVVDLCEHMTNSV